MNEFVDRITVKSIPEQIAEQIKNEIYQGKIKPRRKASAIGISLARNWE